VPLQVLSPANLIIKMILDTETLNSFVGEITPTKEEKEENFRIQEIKNKAIASKLT
jgi:hypothetical protein